MLAFPKIFALGTDYIKDIFHESVEITCKLDGSQFAFGKIKGELYMRSKGKQLFVDAAEKMFELAVNYVSSIVDKLPDNVMFYTEYLQQPRHNVLKYGRVPKNNLALFGAMTFPGQSFFSYDELKIFAEQFDIDVVPLLFHGKVNNINEITHLLDTTSYLGEVKIEGIVVKNYERKFLLGGQPMPLMAGKFVSEAFKEVMRTGWKKENTSPGRWETFKTGYCTEARWQKAVQHLKENGQLENSPKDIGVLLKAIQLDLTEEEKETIKEFLWNEF
jgi:hypothetical protein